MVEPILCFIVYNVSMYSSSYSLDDMLEIFNVNGLRNSEDGVSIIVSSFKNERITQNKNNNSLFYTSFFIFCRRRSCF